MYLVQLIGIALLQVVGIPYLLYRQLLPVSRRHVRCHVKFIAFQCWNTASRTQLFVLGCSMYYIGKHVLLLPTPEVSTMEVKQLLYSHNTDLYVTLLPVGVARVFGITLLVTGIVLATGVVAVLFAEWMTYRTTNVETPSDVEFF